jgi:bacillithiol synthase
MPITRHTLEYAQTGAFSRIVLDYLSDEPALRTFYQHRPNIAGLKAALEQKKLQAVDRKALYDVLQAQYAPVNTPELVKQNLEKLLQENCFTICTAHQPNIFTGHLYFIYKILHAIKLAEYCREEMPDSEFVPVFYMGSEDADLEELGHIFLHGEKLDWKTKQTGAVGRMVVDDALLQLLQRIAGELSVQARGKELVDLLKTSYTKGRLIQEATLDLVNRLFGKYGLIVLIADHPLLKKQMRAVFEDDLLNHQPEKWVAETAVKLEEAGYKVQAHARPINLFYLDAGLRERFEKKEGHFEVLNTNQQLDKDALIQLLNESPEKFSPNVILRGLYQETILPNIAFIGGGGELAYWLQFKHMFSHYQIPFPVLILRNSFMLVNEDTSERMQKTGWPLQKWFTSTDTLINEWVKEKTTYQLSLQQETDAALAQYQRLEKQAGSIDTTLAPHVMSLSKKALKNLLELEKKMLRAEKRKFTEDRARIERVRQTLFPGGGLQERTENILPWLAIFGEDIIQSLYTASEPINPFFITLELSH